MLLVLNSLSSLKIVWVIKYLKNCKIEYIAIMNPLVSVIIPTANRPQYLPRAVRSALAAVESLDIEVIVVPNGRDQSWRESLASFKDNPSVRVIPIEIANANVARNTGMDNARGEFIRFLDDDDFLVPEGAVKQYELIKSSNANICSGTVSLIDHNGVSFGCWEQPQTSDFIAGMLSAKRMSQVTAHVFRRSVIQNELWNSQLCFSQDIEWMLRIGASKELNWIKVDALVGNWVRHIDNRISTVAPLHSRKKITALAILSLADNLNTQSRLTENRKRSAANGLWECVNTTFFMNPIFWLKISHLAKKMHADAHPDTFPYQYAWVKRLNMNPIAWVMLGAPRMYLRYVIKRILLNFKVLKRW